MLPWWGPVVLRRVIVGCDADLDEDSSVCASKAIAASATRQTARPPIKSPVRRRTGTGSELVLGWELGASMTAERAEEKCVTGLVLFPEKSRFVCSTAVRCMDGARVASIGAGGTVTS